MSELGESREQRQSELPIRSQRMLHLWRGEPRAEAKPVGSGLGTAEFGGGGRRKG
jgi:hypothetical protein